MLKHNLDFGMVKYFLRLSCFLIFCVGALAQATPRPEACAELGDTNDFAVADENRGRLQSELPELRAKAKDLKENKIPQSEKAEKQLKDTNAKLENSKEATSDLEKVKTSLEDFLAGKSVEALNKDLIETNDLILWKEVQLKCVNADIRKAFPEQSFKRYMSQFFAILIGLVIIGFFVMAWIDEQVRRAIFSGQTGLQFVTLFSIVIAIILFGITGILEAKELAALLGGLSGYILGRSSAPTGGQAGAPLGQNNGGGGTVPTVVTGLASVAIAPTTAALTVTTLTQQLIATATDANGNPITGPPNYVFQWFCDNAAVATVDQTGLVTRVGPGTCNVTATANGSISNACVVTCQ